MNRRIDGTEEPSYRVPAIDLRTLGKQDRTAVVLGAGPSGLIAALTIAQEGFADVVLLEKRMAFTRRNVVNLHPEALHVFKRLGILEPFLIRASQIIDHLGFVFADGASLYAFRDIGYETAIDPEQPFDIQDVKHGFINETLYSITLADLQDLLARIACDRGIRIISEADVELVQAANGYYSVKLRAGAPPVEMTWDAPALIVLAEGTRAQMYKSIGGAYVPQEGLWPKETWVFGNYGCLPKQGCSHLLFEFSKNCDDLTISNCIFLPHQGEVNISVTVRDRDITPHQIADLISKQAATILRVSGVPVSTRRLVWYSDRPVHIVPRSAGRSHFGKNLILVGDVTGANSPVAALGATLSSSAYSYALRELLKDFAKMGADAALARYGERTQTYVRIWHDKVSQIRKLVSHDIRDKARRWKNPPEILSSKIAALA